MAFEKMMTSLSQQNLLYTQLEQTWLCTEQPHQPQFSPRFPAGKVKVRQSPVPLFPKLLPEANPLLMK